jgi:hypothetical protein
MQDDNTDLHSRSRTGHVFLILCFQDRGSRRGAEKENIGAIALVLFLGFEDCGSHIKVRFVVFFSNAASSMISNHVCFWDEGRG